MHPVLIYSCYIKHAYPMGEDVARKFLFKTNWSIQVRHSLINISQCSPKIHRGIQQISAGSTAQIVSSVQL